MVDRELQVAIEHTRVVARVLLRGEGVQIAAHRVERLRDVLRAPDLRSLEQEVFEEVAGATDHGRLVTRAGQHPHAQRHRAHAGHPLRDDTETRRVLGAVDRHMSVALLGRRRIRALAARLIAEPTAARLVAAAPAAPARDAAALASATAALAAATSAPVITWTTLAAAAAAVRVGAFRNLPLGPDRLQADLALRVDVLDQHGEPVAFLHGLLDALQALAAPQLRDVDQAVAARHQVHERPERGRLHDRSLVGLAHEDRARVGDLVDHVRRLIGPLATRRRADEHGPVVLDVDIGAGERDDLVDPLALRSDDLADLVDGDLDR